MRAKGGGHTRTFGNTKWAYSVQAQALARPYWQELKTY